MTFYKTVHHHPDQMQKSSTRQKVPSCHCDQRIRPSPPDSLSTGFYHLGVDLPVLELLINGLKACVPLVSASLHSMPEIH